MQSIEQILRQLLSSYFSSPAYTRSDQKRFTALQVILKDMTVAVKSGKASAYGLSMPSSVDIARITDCSTCSGKAANTRAARTRCEQFASTWLRISDPEKTFTPPKSLKKTSPVNKTSSNFKKKLEDNNPKPVYINIQAFK